MGFLNNDLVKNAESQFGGEAETALEGEASKFVGQDTANSVVGSLGSDLGIQQPNATPADAPASDSTDDQSSTN